MLMTCVASQLGGALRSTQWMTTNPLMSSSPAVSTVPSRGKLRSRRACFVVTPMTSVVMGGNVRTPRGDYAAPLPQDIRNLWDNFDEDDVIVLSFLRILFITRLQPFWDGNKRTAVMLSAVDLVNNG